MIDKREVQNLLFAIESYNPSSIQKAVNSIPKMDRFEAILSVHKHKHSALHSLSWHPIGFKALLARLSKSERLKVLCLPTNDGYIPLERVVVEPQLFLYVLEFATIKQVVSHFNAFSKLKCGLGHYLQYHSGSLSIFLRQFPKNERLKQVYPQNSKRRTVLENSLVHIYSLVTILKLLPDPDKLKAIRAFKNMHYSGIGCYKLKIIMPVFNLFPEEHKLEVAKAFAVFGESMLYVAMDDIAIFTSILKLYPIDERFAEVSKPGNKVSSILDCAKENPELLLLIYKLLPENNQIKMLHTQLDVFKRNGMAVVLENTSIHPFLDQYLRIAILLGQTPDRMRGSLFDSHLKEIKKLRSDLEKCQSYEQLKLCLLKYVSTNLECTYAQEIGKIIGANEDRALNNLSV